MKKQDAQYRGYVTLLKKELVPAMGVQSRLRLPMRQHRQLHA